MNNTNNDIYKPLLKPPFERFVSENGFVYVIDSEGNKLFVAQDIKRLGEHGQHHLTDFVVSAMNEKYEGDFKKKENVVRPCKKCGENTLMSAEEQHCLECSIAIKTIKEELP